MRKEELIKQVAESTGIAICEVRTVIEAALKETVDAVANGRTLYIYQRFWYTVTQTL
jgi:nucleoid DNA-binding protein